MPIEFVEHFIDNQVRVVGRRTERIALFHTFFARHPVIFQPIQISIRDLHDVPIHDRLVVITSSRKIIAVFIGIIHFGGQSDFFRQLVIYRDGNRIARITRIRHDPFVVYIGISQSEVCIGRSAAQRYAIRICLSSSEEILVIIRIWLPQSSFFALTMRNGIILIEHLSIKFRSPGYARRTCIGTILRIAPRKIIHTLFARPIFILIIGPMIWSFKIGGRRE